MIAKPQRQECRLFKLGGVISLGPIIKRGQSFGKADHFQGAFSDVVCFLGIQSEDAVRHRTLGNDDPHDCHRPERPECGQSVVSIRSPVVAVLGASDDHRVDEAIELVDRVGQSCHVSLGQVALVRGRADPVDRKDREDLPPSSERFAIHREHRSLVRYNLGSELAHGGGRSSQWHLTRGKPSRLHGLLRAPLPPVPRGRFRLSHRTLGGEGSAAASNASSGSSGTVSGSFRTCGMHRTARPTRPQVTSHEEHPVPRGTSRAGHISSIGAAGRCRLGGRGK